MATLTLKIECECGTRFKFDVEPVDGKMPVEVYCPHCGLDGTDQANAQITAILAGKPPPPKIEVPKPFKAETAKPVLKLAGKRPPQHTVTLPPQVQKIAAEKPAPKYPHESPVNKMVVVGVIMLLTVLVAAWVWYSFFGSKPRVRASVPIEKARRVEFCRFIGPDQVLLKTDRAMSLHEAGGLKQLWSTDLSAYQAPFPEWDEEDSEMDLAALKGALQMDALRSGVMARFGSYLPSDEFQMDRVQVFGGELWVLFQDSLVVFDRNTGKEKKKVALTGTILGLTAGDSVLFAASTGRPNEVQLTRVAFRTGDVFVEKFQIPEPPKFEAGRASGTMHDDSTALLGGFAGMMEAGMVAGTEQELDREVDAHQLRYIPAGVNVARLQIDLIEKNVIARQTVKPEDLKPKEEPGKDGPMKVTDALALAQQMQYEAVQSRGGIFEKSDESRYKVTLQRFLEDGAPRWSGEMVGPPVLAPLKSVDVLLSSKSMVVFDKENEKLWEAPLAFPASSASISFGEGRRGPCLEAGDTLYLYDTEALASFELTTGKVRWRMPLPGVKSIRLDGKGMLYVTNADSVSKVDPQNGKIAWTLNEKDVQFYLSGKYVYLSKEQVSGADMIRNMWTGKDIPTHFRIFRVDPRSGEILWEYYKPKAPTAMDFKDNQVLLLFPNELIKDPNRRGDEKPQYTPGELQLLKYVTF
jgi:hypothetical protein